MQIQDFLQISKIIPVITIYDIKSSIQLARALIEGGIKVLEITLRTKYALEAISIINQEVPEAIVGAGTVLNISQLEQAKKYGAKFAISPGINSIFAKEAVQLGFPLMPGVASASEIMLALEFGFHNLKFFPAEAAGGINMLKSFIAPFETVRFCPTGGISMSNINEYLKLSNVLCVGGSWLAPKEYILNGQWEEITKLCKTSLNAILNI